MNEQKTIALSALFPSQLPPVNIHGRLSHVIIVEIYFFGRNNDTIKRDDEENLNMKIFSYIYSILLYVLQTATNFSRIILYTSPARLPLPSNSSFAYT